MSSSENIGHDKPTFDPIKRLGTLDGGFNANLARPLQLDMQVFEGNPGPNVGLIRPARMAHVTGPSCHAGGTVTIRHGRRHLLGLGARRVDRRLRTHIVQHMIENRPVNDVAGAIVLGAHSSRVDIAGGRISIIPLHDIRQALPPEFEIHAEDFQHVERPPSLALLCSPIIISDFLCNRREGDACVLSAL